MSKPNGITKDEMTRLHAFTMALSGDEAHDNSLKKEKENIIFKSNGKLRDTYGHASHNPEAFGFRG